MAFGVIIDFLKHSGITSFNVVMENNYPTSLYLSILSFKNETEIFLFSIFTDSNALGPPNQIVTLKPLLQGNSQPPM